MSEEIPSWYYEVKSNSAFLDLVNNGDVEEVKSAIDNGQKITLEVINAAIDSNDINMVKLILSYDPYVSPNIIKNIFDLLDDTNIINVIINYLIKIDKLNFSKSIINSLLKNESYSEEKKDIIKSLLFRQCINQDIDELKRRLRYLHVNIINNIPIDDIKSSIILCDLINKNLYFNIHKYDNGYEMEINPRLKFID